MESSFLLGWMVVLLLLFSVSDTVSGNTGLLPVATIRSDGAAGIFQVATVKWCVWGVEIVPFDQGGYLVRAAALWGDLINRNRLHPLSFLWSADPGGQIHSPLPSVVATEMSHKICS